MNKPSPSVKTKTVVHINCSPVYNEKHNCWVIDVGSDDYSVQSLLPSESIEDADERLNAMLDFNTIHSFFIETPTSRVVKQGMGFKTK
jgi:hypothetical protein